MEQAAPSLPRAQSAALLLRVCGLGRLTHRTRLLLPAATEAIATAADAATLETYTRLLRLDPLTPRQRRQARLSAACGLLLGFRLKLGLGLRLRLLQRLRHQGRLGI